MTTPPTPATPRSDVDLFSDEALLDPYPRLRELRDAGPAVWLDRHGAYAVTRYADVRAVLADDETFVSGQGVGLNEIINAMGPGTTLMSDGEVHRHQREIIGRPLTPSALTDLRPDAQSIAAALADRVVARGTFDAIADLAEVLPATWVPDLLGWPSDGRDRLLDWAAATFDGLGPMNDRAATAGESILDMIRYAQRLTKAELPEGCFAARILRAADAGEIEPARCPMLFIDYLGPSLDTTISAVGNAIWLFATHPDQWDLLRREPKRLKAAFNEVLRLESPINCFTRVATSDAVIGGAGHDGVGHLSHEGGEGVEIPAGSRVLLSFASANRDERRWADPERFDITRESAGQLAFGYGEHACVGMGLARLEGAAVLGALLDRVSRIELADEPTRKINNLIRSFQSLPVTVHPAPRS